MVLRYEPFVGCSTNGDDGSFVSYEDYRELELELEKLKAKIYALYMET